MSDAINDELDGELSTFSSFGVLDDNIDSSIDNDQAVPTSVDSPFTITIDSREQQPYTFLDITGDFRNDYSPIRVLTIRKSMPVGDYAILRVPGICIERKSKADLFSSLSDSAKRDNFVERLRKIQEGYEFGAVLIECYPSELFNDPPIFTSLNPKSILRSTFSWAQQFPLVHWYWALDRSMAEQMCYRILEKFYQHKTELKYKHHNKPIDSNLESFRQGQLARMASEENEIPYVQGNPLRISWLRGWGFYSTHFLGGDLGQLYEAGSLPTSTPRERAKIKAEEKKFKPLPGQKVLLFDDPNEELKHWVGSQFATSVGKKSKKKSNEPNQ